jgi:hypothetical protein
MDHLPDPDGARRSRRPWLLLVGAVIAFAAIFTSVERLVTPETATTAEGAAAPTGPLDPIRPEIVRLDEVEVQVSVGRNHRLRIHFDDEAEADALIACLEEGIASSAELAEGEAAQPPAAVGFIARHRRAQQVWDEVMEIQDACMLGSLDAPIPPVPPPPDRR